MFGLITDIESIIGLESLQHAINKKIEEIGSNDHFYLMLTHIRNPFKIVQCLKILLYYCNIKHIYIPYSLDMKHDNKWNKLQTYILQAIKDESEETSSNDDINYDLDTKEKEKEYLNNENDRKLSDLNIVFQRFPVSLYASSKNYDIYRKLIKIGKLKGSLVWDNAENETSQIEWINPFAKPKEKEKEKETKQSTDDHKDAEEEISAMDGLIDNLGV